MIDRRPALIARCTGDADVVAAVNFARAQELLVAVRAGGHSVPGYGACDGGIVIDVAPMKGIWVEPDKGIARAQSGLTWGEFDRETQLVGLATTGGRRTSTGVAGQTLGSGSGWLERKFGLTCDNLLAAKLVTAEGEIVRADESENPDLLLGPAGRRRQLRRGDVVAVPAPPRRSDRDGRDDGLAAGPGRRGAALLAGLRGDRPRRVRQRPGLPHRPAGAVRARAPAGPAGPRSHHLLLGAPEDGEAMVQAVPGARSRPRHGAADALLGGADPHRRATPHGLHNYWKAENLPELSDAAIDTIVDTAAGMTSPLSMILIEPKGRAIGRVGEADSALGGRDAAHTLYCFSLWTDPAESDAHIAWTRSLMDTMAPFTMPGVSLNFTSDQQASKARESFGSAEKNRRLTALKDRYDPTNFFRLNQNIRPSAGRRQPARAERLAEQRLHRVAPQGADPPDGDQSLCRHSGSLPAFPFDIKVLGPSGLG